MKTLRNMTKIAGIGYLVIFISGFFANFFVLENSFVASDAAATSNNIMNNEMLFRYGTFSFLIMVIADVLLAWPLYVLLKPVNKHLSQFSSWLRLVNGTIFGVALFNLFNVIQILGDSNYTSLLEPNQVHAHVMLLLNAFDYTWLIGLVFFGMHLFVMGYLVIKSNYIPKIIGVLLMVAAAGYLADSFAHFLLTNYEDYSSIFEMIVVIPGVLGELSFTLWILIKGIRKDKVPNLD